MTPRSESDGKIACWRHFPQAIGLPVDAREVEEFAKQFGTISTRDGGLGVWPVAPTLANGTFSQTNLEAHLHTDAQYHEIPESAFILACSRPALDGGENLLLDAFEARRIAMESLGVEGLCALEDARWRWLVPDIFQNDGIPKQSSEHPVFALDGSIRWRSDNICCHTNHDVELAAAFTDSLNSSKAIERIMLHPGDVLICDNLYALHGRTSFTDRKRLLYRVRLL